MAAQAAADAGAANWVACELKHERRDEYGLNHEATNGLFRLRAS